MDDNKIFLVIIGLSSAFAVKEIPSLGMAHHVLESLWYIVKKENPSMQLTIEEANSPLLRTMTTFISPAFYLIPEI